MKISLELKKNYVIHVFSDDDDSDGESSRSMKMKIKLKGKGKGTPGRKKKNTKKYISDDEDYEDD